LEHSKATAVDTLQSMATKYDKSIAQIMLRWALQRGTAVIPGTGNPNHMRQNLAIYDFEISNEDMNIIDSLKESTHAKKFMHMDVSNFA
jgi:diketogulonate reductase-like aldo/keto reductase